MNQVQQFLEYILNAIKIWVIVQPWQQGLRVRTGKKVKLLGPGIFFRLPYFDSVYIQEDRLRVLSMPMQTLTSKDQKTMTINGSIGYVITDIELLYNTLFHPELTVQNICMSEAADFIFKTELTDINPEAIQKVVLDKLNEKQYGMRFEYYRITNFAVVKTFRIIQDQSWVNNGLSMDTKK
jgi:regulator of protease activity HflC (stomatin/prohibitin superfamily)